MVSSKHVAVFAASLLGTATAAKCKPQTTFQTVITTASWLTGVVAPSSSDNGTLTGVPASSSDDGSSLTDVGAPSSSVDGTWITGVSAPSHDGASLTGVGAPSSTITGTWLGSSDTKSVPEPSSTSPVLGAAGKEAPMGSGNSVAPLTCFLAKQGVCDVHVTGFVDQKWMEETYTGKSESVRACEQSCSAFKGCTAFSYDDAGVCFLGTRPWSEAGFIKDSGPGAKVWADAACFTCYDYSVLSLDFEDGNVDDWNMDLADEDLSWLWDIPKVASPYGQALRFGEPEGEGEGAKARLIYSVTFPLEAGRTYALGYQMRVKRSSSSTKNYDAVTFTIATNDEIIYEFTPESSDVEPLLGMEKFTLRNGEEGDATLSIVVISSGNGHDYYFDHLFVTL